MDRYKTNYVYLVKEYNSEFYKIGRTNNLTQRLSTLQTGNPRRLILVDVIDCGDKQLSVDIEHELHELLSHVHIKGEWFKDSDETQISYEFNQVKNVYVC